MRADMDGPPIGLRWVAVLPDANILLLATQQPEVKEEIIEKMSSEYLISATLPVEQAEEPTEANDEADYELTDAKSMMKRRS